MEAISLQCEASLHLGLQVEADKQKVQLTSSLPDALQKRSSTLSKVASVLEVIFYS